MVWKKEPDRMDFIKKSPEYVAGPDTGIDPELSFFHRAVLLLPVYRSYKKEKLSGCVITGKYPEEFRPPDRVDQNAF